MKHDLPSLDALKVFEAAARHLSFSRAAEELCLTKGAVSYQIRKLEADLDCALFQRSVRQVYLTNAGQQLMQTVRRLFAELGQTLAQIRPGEIHPDVSIGATTYVALRWLSPRLSGFGERNPEVSILLQHAVNADDFSLQNVDFAIRWVALGEARPRGCLLELPMPLFPACSPALLERQGLRRQAGGLPRAALATAPLDATPLLCEDRKFDLWQIWYGEEPAALENPRRVISDANVRVQAAIDGQGWILADAMMQVELDSGKLVAPFAHRLEGYGYALLASPGRFVSRKANELKDWIVEHA